MTNLEYLLELKKHIESEIDTIKSRIEYRKGRIKILENLIEKQERFRKDRIRFLLEFKIQLEKEMRDSNFRLSFKEEHLKIVDELINEEQQN